MAVFPHDRPGAEEFLAAYVIERRARVLQHMKLVEHGLGASQGFGHHVAIRPVHVHADSLHRPRAVARPIVQ